MLSPARRCEGVLKRRTMELYRDVREVQADALHVSSTPIPLEPVPSSKIARRMHASFDARFSGDEVVRLQNLGLSCRREAHLVCLLGLLKPGAASLGLSASAGSFHDCCRPPWTVAAPGVEHWSQKVRPGRLSTEGAVSVGLGRHERALLQFAAVSPARTPAYHLSILEAGELPLRARGRTLRGFPSRSEQHPVRPADACHEDV